MRPTPATLRSVDSAIHMSMNPRAAPSTPAAIAMLNTTDNGRR